MSDYYEKQYDGREYYWGKKASTMCARALEFFPPRSGATVIDLGCGEGRNTVFFAEHGFTSIGLDISPTGLGKAHQLAEERHVGIETFPADIKTVHLDRSYDIVFSTGTLHYLPPEIRTERFEHFKAMTSPNGIHVVAVFVAKPFIAPAPDAEEGSRPYRSGELMGYYHDWEILFSAEEIFDCLSGGIPHRHCVDRIVARRYQDNSRPDYPGIG